MKPPLFSNPEELATAVSKLRYDALDRLLTQLAVEISNQGAFERDRGRIRLADAIGRLAMNLHDAARNAGGAWHICEATELIDV